MKNATQRSLKLTLGAGVLFVLTMGVPTMLRAQDDHIYSADELTAQPAPQSVKDAARIISRSYPHLLRERKIEGSVLLEFVIEPDGKVDKATIQVVAATVRQLGEAASGAIQKIKFKPGKVDGKAVRTRVRFPLRYRVK